ncbi:MAG: class I SAM-dependent methyltransferase [Candidatus Omnitrophota bacterium]
MISQKEQDLIWYHYQNNAKGIFDLSYPRLRFLAKLCPKKMRVLNIGVGSGHLEKMLIERGVDVYSLDPCQESITKLQTALKMGNQAKQGYSYSVPFGAGIFDKVIMTEVLEHLPNDALHATLDEVRRVLKPKGEFTGTVPYREVLTDSEVLCPHCKAQFHRWGHLQSFDLSSLKSLLKEHNFYVICIYPRSFPDFKRRGIKYFIKAVFRYILGRMGEPLVGPNLYFIARVNYSKKQK